MSSMGEAISLLLCLSQLIVISQADWKDPRLLPPDPKFDVVTSLQYNTVAQQANINLKEEVTYPVCIAILNYDGSDEPKLGRLEEGKNNFLLGAELKKNDSTGQWLLWITKPQDYETPIMRDYRFPIVAGSVPYPTVALNIENIDDNPPIIHLPKQKCEIEENYVGPSNCTYVISDEDGWIYEIVASLDNTGKENFDLITSRVTGSRKDYEINANLIVTKDLDFETISMHMFLIKAIDGAKHESNLSVVVEVIDMPDEPPVWISFSGAEYILEKTTKTFAVKAVDGDIKINAPINYRIEVENTRDEAYFSVEKETGLITIHEIDRDALQMEFFRFMIIAYEVPEPESKINSSIIVIVEDQNDHEPEITPKVLAIEIEEETYKTLEFNPPINIVDPDLAENGQFSVSLIDDSEHQWSSAFLVVPTSGYQKGVFTISVVNASLLDYEDPNWRNITIKLRAEEKANSTHVNVRNIDIRLINWNDELPIFDSDNVLKTDVPEDVVADYYISTVHATDRDVDDNVTHSLLAQPMLTIDEKTGEIVTNQNDAFDYESMPLVVVQVVATDLADHKTYATLVINVIDVNDVPPKLYLPKQSPTLVEEEPKGTEVKALINATDIDTDAELFFSIDWDNTKAHKRSVPVDESQYRGRLEIRTDFPKNHTRYAEATIFVTGRIDYEAFDVMFLSIMVTDNKTVHNEPTTSASLTLNIIDINDNSPEFKDPEKMTVEENKESEVLIGTIIATDADGPEYNNVTYYIEATNGTKDDLVQINPLTGVIRVKLNKGIDAEEYEYISYNVTATDGTNNSTLPIDIEVIDQNDVVPNLLPDKFNKTIYISEKSPSGFEVVKVWAEDGDRTSPFNNVSYLINLDYSASMQYFSMGKYDGWLKVHLTDNHILDRDFGQPEFTLNLKLRDNFIDAITWNTNTVDYTVNVILLDINDQKPLLPDKKDPVEVLESTKKNDLVMTVVADDRDDPTTNNTKVFYNIRSIEPIDGTYDQRDEDCTDLFIVKTRNQSAADVYANCNLRGYYGRWALELYAQDLGVDPGPQNHSNNYVIQVNDVNYNAPVIEFPTKDKIIPLRAEQTLHAQLRTYDEQLLNDFNATDKDHGNSGIVTFSLPSEGDNEYFKVVPSGKNVAQLQLAKAVDLEKQNSYTLRLTATDGGNLPLEVSQNVTVVFITSSGPKFDDNKWTVWFTENKTGLDEFAVIPEARDMVSETGGNTVDIYYFFMDEDGDAKFFELNKVTRKLTIVEELDREEQEIMTLIVVATTDKNGPPRNPNKDSVLNITVVVVDVNDNPPVFEKKPYRGGVAIEDALDKVIFTAKATDKDINETLTYAIVVDSLSYSDTSLDAVSNPFAINSQTGDLTLKFTVRSSMKGYFEFGISVHDAVDHADITPAQIYVVSQNNRVVFTFNNVARYVKENENFIIESFQNAFNYVCNIDDIKSTVDANGQVLDNTTSVTTHFISPEDNLPINSSAIILASSNLQTITKLREELLARSLRLVDVPTGASSSTSNTQDIVHWVLVSLTILFGLCSIVLLVAYVIRTRRLTQRLDKLAITQYGSQESDLDRTGVVPTTNQFAVAGSNPMWKTTNRAVDDNISNGSGDSDLIGIENNPDFGYSNEAFGENDLWENARRRSVINPVLANHEAIFGSFNDRGMEIANKNSNREN